MSTSRKIAEWVFRRPGNLPELKAKVFMASPQANSEHEDPFTFYAEIEGRKGVTEQVENINDLSRLLQVMANPKAGLDWLPVYFVGIRHHRDRQKAVRPQDAEEAGFNRTNSTSANLEVSFRSGWMATKGKARYFCARDPRAAMHLEHFEITSDLKDLLGNSYRDSSIQIYPGTDATREALDSLVGKLEALSKSLDALNKSENLTLLTGLLALPEK